MSSPETELQGDVVLLTGMSGGGKSVAMHALEDAGYFCVDNLPAELLLDFLKLEQQRGERRVAIAVDVRSAGSLPLMLPLLKDLRARGVAVRSARNSVWPLKAMPASLITPLCTGPVAMASNAPSRQPSAASSSVRST